MMDALVVPAKRRCEGEHTAWRSAVNMAKRFQSVRGHDARECLPVFEGEVVIGHVFPGFVAAGLLDRDETGLHAEYDAIQIAM
jgi:hypothetical protein